MKHSVLQQEFAQSTAQAKQSGRAQYITIIQLHMRVFVISRYSVFSSPQVTHHVKMIEDCIVPSTTASIVNHAHSHKAKKGAAAQGSSAEAKPEEEISRQEHTTTNKQWPRHAPPYQDCNPLDTWAWWQCKFALSSRWRQSWHEQRCAPCNHMARSVSDFGACLGLYIVVHALMSTVTWNQWNGCRKHRVSKWKEVCLAAQLEPTRMRWKSEQVHTTTL